MVIYSQNNVMNLYGDYLKKDVMNLYGDYSRNNVMNLYGDYLQNNEFIWLKAKKTHYTLSQTSNAL